jgi:phosphatidylglycerol lysyltransferase
MQEKRSEHMAERLRRALPAMVGLVLFAAALLVLRKELHAVTWHELTADILAARPAQLWAAVLLTALSYAALTGYDLLAFAYIGNPLSRWRVAGASALAYAVANSVGFAMFSGAAVRYRFYTRWGVSARELSRIVFSYSVTFWLGLLTLGGISLVTSPLPGAHDLHTHGLVAAAGWLLVLASVAYLVLVLVRRAPIRVRGFELPLPSPTIAFAQLGVSAVDWTLAAAVLYVLLPESDLSFPTLLGAFLAAQLLGLASHVPGGVGVFEGLMVIVLKPFLSSAQLLPALVVYRLVYYVLPLAVALLILVADELRQRREQTERAGAFLGWLSEEVTPRVLAVFTFLAGAGLLFSGATPAAPGRLPWLDRLLPLGVVEASHFIGSLVGAGLLLVSQALARRLDAAYYLAAGGMAVGIAASLFKGADFEEATLLALLLLVLWRARPAFDRRAAVLETRFSAGWIAAVVATLGASVWLGLFAFKHVEYSHEMWWQFELGQEASRFLRSSVGAAVALALFGFGRLMRPSPHEAPDPTDADLDAASAAIAAQTSTFPYLVYLRDKALLFDEDRKGFVMYGVQGRAWVALGDPVGPPDRRSGLVRLFLERCDDFDGVPVFYEVAKEGLHRYADFGLTFVKLGEEARVDLPAFSLEGGQASKHRQVLKRLEKDGGTFRIIPAPEVPAVMDQLQAVSDDWLREKTASEKGFSLGFFDPGYLARFPVAVVERQGRIQAFANLWLGPGQFEISVDLMRYHKDAPKSAMEALFVHLLRWARDQGYRWFVLGMAPFSGFERSPVAPLWTRLGSFLYHHGETLYNFQGLRAYKEKFNPTWEPRYLAYPGGLALPRILADVAALIAGGYRRIFLR